MQGPLSVVFNFSHPAEMVAALLVGLGFGFVLERGGFGRADNLAAVFYGRDFRVLRVMFTAIVTAMLGLYLCDLLGIMPLGSIGILDTYLLPQLVGGLLLGAGFIIGGYCPGTSIAAIATGRKDAMMFAVGMLAGVWAYAQFTPGIDEWIKATAQGEMTLPTVTGIGMGWWVLAFTAFLAFAAWGMSTLEQRFAGLEPKRR